MKISQLKTEFTQRLKSQYPETEIETFFNWLVENFCGLSRLQVALEPNFELSDQQMKEFEDAIQQLLAHKPIQYITEKTEFYGLEFKVNPSVLIPRPETEELVDWILKDLPKNSSASILDIGTGSGCIAISMAKNLPKAKVSAIDVSDSALDTARQNAQNNKVDIDFLQQDILHENPKQNFDIIVSNPPYVREEEKQEMKPNVLEHEPDKALFVDDSDHLLFYRRIASLAKEQRATIYMEINQYLAKETEEVFKSLGFSTELRKDIFRNYRMLKADFKF